MLIKMTSILSGKMICCHKVVETALTSMFYICLSWMLQKGNNCKIARKCYLSSLLVPLMSWKLEQVHRLISKLYKSKTILLLSDLKSMIIHTQNIPQKEIESRCNYCKVNAYLIESQRAFTNDQMFNWAVSRKVSQGSVLDLVLFKLIWSIG